MYAIEFNHFVFYKCGFSLQCVSLIITYIEYWSILDLFKTLIELNIQYSLKEFIVGRGSVF